MTNVPTQHAIEQQDTVRGQLAEFWFYFSENKTAVAGLIFMLGVIFVAVFADMIAPHDPSEQFRAYFEVPPAWMVAPACFYWAPIMPDGISCHVLSMAHACL